MDGLTLSRAFEPFFTTKESGTGFGLATVFGIVRQAGGYVWAYSEPGHGALFKVYLPAVDAPVEPPSPSRPAPVRGGHERLLVVEDDDQVRRALVRIFKGAGYDVTPCEGSAAALAAWEAADGAFDLLISDVIMPGMRGPELAARLLERTPRLRVLFLSGYTEDRLRGEVSGPGRRLVTKPFTPADLLQTVRDLLDDPGPASTPQ